ncbi:MAG TPA: hypothetical protein VF657_08135 [Actinoplanes sp.]
MRASLVFLPGFDVSIKPGAGQVKGQNTTLRRRLSQNVAQPSELCVADLSVSLARHEGVEGDDPVSVHQGDSRTFTVGSLELSLRPVPPIGFDVATAQHRRELRPFVVVTGAEDRGDAAFTGEPANQLERIGIRLARAVIGDISRDYDHV